MDKGEYCGAVFIDLNKAFDTVGHGRLLSKLPFYGIKDKELTWFEDYLFGRRQCARVIYDDTCSESQPVVCGVPQGSILGPLLFILLINDIDHQLNSCKILLYADDTVVFTSSKNQETIEENLNSDLSNLAAWFYENKHRMKNHICPHIRTGCRECKCRECNTFAIVRINVQMFQAMPFKR